MAYKQNFGPSRVSGYNKTKQVAGQSSLFRLGSSPLNHDMDFDHEHDGENDRYSRQVPVKPSTKRQSKSGRRKLAKNIADAANAQAEGYEGTQYNTEGHMRGGRGGKIKVGGRNLLEVKTGTRGGGAYGSTGSTEAKYSKVKERDVRKQLKKTGSASVVDGKISSGTTQTKTAYGSVKRDTKKKAAADKRAKNTADLKQRRETYEKLKADKKADQQAKRNQSAADLVKRRKEYAANKNKK